MSLSLLESVSAQVWKNIALYSRYGISYGEDAITAAMLLDIVKGSPRNLLVKDARPTESSTGCDFDLWIGSRRRGWYRYAVQAKKIKVATEGYPKLHHLVGAAKVPQIDLLDRYASRNAVTPLYCFYNFVDRPIAVSEWNCPLELDEEQLGCTVTPSHVVRGAISRTGYRSFAAIHGNRYTMPLRCLWKCAEGLPGGGPHATPHQRIFGQQVWHELLPEPLREAIQSQKNMTFDDLLDRGLFGGAGDRLLPRYVAVLDVSDYHC